MATQWPKPSDYQPFDPTTIRTLADVFRTSPAFAYTFLKIRDSKERLIPFRYNAAQMAYYTRQGHRNVILKPRQLGFSTAIAGQMYESACTRQRFSGLVLSHDDQATKRLRLILGRFHENHPAPQPLLARASDTFWRFADTDSEYTIWTAGGGRAGRGGTLSRIHASEVAFWTDPEGILSGAMQAGDPELDLESTANGAQGYFYELCMRALDGDPDWVFHFYPWWWGPEYTRPINPDLTFDTAPHTEQERHLMATFGVTPEQINWRRHKAKDLGEQLFLQEFPEDPLTCFITSGYSFFATAQQCWDAPLDVTPPSRLPGRRRFIGGLDWGQSNDYTALAVFDLETMNQVALFRINRMRFAEMRASILEQCKMWKVCELYVEQNSMGATVEDLIAEAAAADFGLEVNPFTTSEATKGPWLTALRKAMETHACHLQPHPVQRHEFGNFVARQTRSNAWTYQAAGEGHDDTVIAVMAAFNGAVGHINPRISMGRAPSVLSEFRG